MRQSHLAVIGGPDHERVLEQIVSLKCIENIDEVTIDELHQVAVEVDIRALLLVCVEPTDEVGDAQKLTLSARLARKLLIDGGWQADLALDPRVVVSRINVVLGVEQNVVR